MTRASHCLKRLSRLAPAPAALAGALWVNSAAAHSGHEHTAGSSWSGRVEDILVGGVLLLVCGLIYWFANLRGEDRLPEGDAAAESRD